MKRHVYELLRYIINGLAATAVHFAALAFCFSILGIPSAGLSNLIAAFFGITTSFLGSRYFVFPKTSEGFVTQALKFSGLYGFIAIIHGVVLLIWTDWIGFDYRLGFLLATAIQVSLSYLGNKFLVFRIAT
ncbi:MAG: GtrA family protein [Desulfuromonadales bacterium]|uniref:GtrA family protein n=1 Tax=Desulfuromonas sp. KJ2020 TaxID=2919173 RepID=UPI0020A7D2AD|nr:GtrA family protein [Desulfuromonas sp. KJ2020]MCP3177584.1 GtrA family protein [Desulfuromonas sp. KJ2020]